MYAADFEQHAFYEQQSQRGGRGEFPSGFIFNNSNYQALSVSGIDHAYSGMFMPSFPQTMQYSPGIAVHSGSEILAHPEGGAVSFNNESQYFQEHFGVHGGNGRRGKRGGKQEYNRGRQKYNESIPPVSYNQHEYEHFTDHSYSDRDNFIGSNAFDGRYHKKGGHRGKSNIRGTGFHGRDEHYSSRFRGNRNNMVTPKRKNNHNLGLEQHQQKASNFPVGDNNHGAPSENEVTSEQFNAGLSNSVRGKHGKNNLRVGSASCYRGFSQAPTINERRGDRPVSRELLRNGRPNTDSTWNPQALNQIYPHDNRPSSSFSHRKETKDAPGPSSKENDESQRGKCDIIIAKYENYGTHFSPLLSSFN